MIRTFKGNLRTSVFGLFIAAGLTACGGSSNNGSSGTAPVTVTIPPTTLVPASASASVAGFIAYLQLLVAIPSTFTDFLEPVSTTGVVAPTSDTTEPTVVN